MMRDDFSPTVKTTLAGRAGWKCSFPNCGRSTAGPSAESADKWIKNGIAAHISAAAPGGPRYDINLTHEQRSDISNAIWMCPTHGTLIDKDQTAYTTADIKEWKAAAELRAKGDLENPPAMPQRSGYSAKDTRILSDYSEVLSYQVIQLIRNEPFGSFVKHAVTDPFYKILDMKDDPKFQFQDASLEAIRTTLNSQAMAFFKHFGQHSGGLPSGYEYINMSELARRYPASRDYWQQQIYKTQDLAGALCDTAMSLLRIKENS